MLLPVSNYYVDEARAVFKSIVNKLATVKVENVSQPNATHTVFFSTQHVYVYVFVC